MRVLVIVAHPDDEVLGVGGTILKHSKNNDFVKVIYLATGITSRDKSDQKNSTKKEIDSLRTDAKKHVKF